MNNDRISNTPGGERMLLGGIVLGLALIGYAGLRYEIGKFGFGVLMLIMAWGLVQLGRGLFEWKYTDRKAFDEARARQNLLIDVPTINGSRDTLNAMEDALVSQFVPKRKQNAT